MTPSPQLNLAIRAAREAGTIALQQFDRHAHLKIEEKGRSDLVSEADQMVEKEILFHLRKGYPQWDVVAEESRPRRRQRSEWCWVVDPIDGTTNFIHGIPHFAISIALMREQEVMAGVVYHPVSGELFMAERGAGAFLNDHRIRISKTERLQQALICTGFPVRHAPYLPPYLTLFNQLLPLCHDMRRSGSAALDLAYTAAGRFDGFWEVGLAPWDMAAGVLLLREAGGIVSDLNGRNSFIHSGHIVAANPVIHEQLVAHTQAWGSNQSSS
ncbi:MAG: inositol monophosphatase [Magnetococcales bacterium]|nr:inositol monophosphatase [Magnetococcales bacterium]